MKETGSETEYNEKTHMLFFYDISKPIQDFSYSFHVLYTELFTVYFYTVLSLCPFLFNQSQTKAGAAKQMIQSCFC